ncbi:Uncharacterized protein dnm_023710 [Desulfonema magnum]|uniref:Uncharacterized protein n=1 Tax=Desulfonema magnum TaxID=45655 RepID=A0A975BJ77_9BACT|nr:Uncharacterized protein dnm_023710 [Desulfonema magnum]
MQTPSGSLSLMHMGFTPVRQHPAKSPFRTFCEKFRSADIKLYFQ